MASSSLSRSFEELEILVSKNCTSPERLKSKVKEVIELWKVFKVDYSRDLLELEGLKKETSKNNQIFQLKLLTSPPPYSPVTLFERRNFVKKEYPSEFDILKERNRILEDSLSLSPSPPSSGYGSPSLSSGYGSPSPSPLSFSGKRFSGDSEFTSIRQRGSETKYSIFQSFSNQPLLCISVVELSLLEIHPQLLFPSLEEHSRTITTLRLDRVLFKGNLNQRLEMPPLQQFYCHQNTNTSHKCENNNISKETFKSLLFFGNWEIHDILSLPVRRIELIVDGWTQFKLNHENGEIISKLSFTNEILHQLGSRGSTFQLKKLGLQACKLDISPTLVFPNSVTYLNFQSILTTNLTIVEILRACTNLRELRFKNYVDTNGIYLKDIPSQHLKYLCLGLCTYTLAIKYSPGITFPVLDTLVFPTNIMDVKILENLSNIFKCKKAVIYLCSSINCNIFKTGYSILDQLLQIDEICSIRMNNFHRITTEGMNVKLYEEMEEFLISSSLSNQNVSNFALEKKVVELGRVKWIGREITSEEHQVLEFQHRDGHKFSCWESYLKRY